MGVQMRGRVAWVMLDVVQVTEEKEQLQDIIESLEATAPRSHSAAPHLPPLCAGPPRRGEGGL